MLYALVHPVAKLGFRIFYRHIHICGMENIPADGPVIIAANHPTAFIEPCLAACHQHRTLNFIVRGDIFKNPFYIKLLKSLHLIPIFRFKDGFANLKNNQETFRYCNDVIKDRKAIFILAEGRTIQEKKLRPIQKGAARMAFGAFDAFGVEDTMIVPMGFTYEKANSWRKDVMISCGKPIYLKDYLEDYKANPNQAIQSVTDKLADSLKTNIVCIDARENEWLCDQIFEINRNKKRPESFPVLIKNNQQLISEQKIAKVVNYMTAPENEELRSNIKNYTGILNKYRIKDINVAGSRKLIFIYFLVYAIMLILSIPGLIFNMLPVLTAQTIATKKVYVKEFYAPVLFALVSFLMLIWYFTLLIFGGLLFGLKMVFILLFLGFLGFSGILAYEKLIEIMADFRYQKLSSALKQELKQKRQKILNWLGKHI